jgi:hypothetical protein
MPMFFQLSSSQHRKGKMRTERCTVSSTASEDLILICDVSFDVGTPLPAILLLPIVTIRPFNEVPLSRFLTPRQHDVTPSCWLVTGISLSYRDFLGIQSSY